jgi:hypothetical protein
MKIILDVFGGGKIAKFQNDLMHAVDVFESGKHFAYYFQLEISGEPDLDKLCERLKNAYEQSGGYILFAAIRNINDIRSKEPKAYIKEGIQTISTYQNNVLGWSLFSDMLIKLGYKTVTNEYMMVESIS